MFNGNKLDLMLCVNQKEANTIYLTHEKKFCKYRK